MKKLIERGNDKKNYDTDVRAANMNNINNVYINNYINIDNHTNKYNNNHNMTTKLL